MSLHMSILRGVFQFTTALRISSTWTPLVFKARYFMPWLSGSGLKSWVYNNPVLLKEKLNSESPPGWGSPCQNGLTGKWCLDLCCLSVAFLSLAHVTVLLHEFSGLFSEEIVPCVALDSVCTWEDVGSGSFSITILNHLSDCILFSSFRLPFPSQMLDKLFSEPCKIPVDFCCFLFVCFCSYSSPGQSLAQKEIPSLISSSSLDVWKVIPP